MSFSFDAWGLGVSKTVIERQICVKFQELDINIINVNTFVLF